MSLTDLLTTLRRRLWLVLLPTLIGVLAAGGLVYTSSEQYRASTLLYVSASGASDPSSLASGTMFVQSQIRSYPPLVTTSGVLDAVSEEMGGALGADELATRVTAEVPQDSTLLRLTVTSGDEAETRTLSNAFANAVTAEILRLESPAGEGDPAIRVQRINQPAEVAGRGAVPLLAAGGLIGFAVGMALALFTDRRRVVASDA